MIKRWEEFNRDIKPLTEIFNIEQGEAQAMFIDEEPSSEWRNQQEDNESKKDENLLHLPLKNIIFQDKTQLKLFLFDKVDKPIVYARFDKFEDGLQSKIIVKSKSANIPNLGLMIYESIVNDLNLPIYSDNQQTDASKKKIWAKLFQKYPQRVIAYNKRTKKESKITNSTSEFNPVVNNDPVYNNKKDTKVNSHGENHPDNKLVDWPTGGINPLTPFFIEDMFQEKNLYLLKFKPA